MKKSKKLLLTALSATLVMSASTAVALTAFADTATKDHEFSGKYDAVFEDFDRADISNTVKADAGVKTGEKPYLHVNYTAGTSASAAAPIYKQGSGSLAQVQTGGSVILTLRAPENDVALSEIMFGIRGVDSDAAVFAKPLSELTDSSGDSLPALTSEWQTYEISFTTSFENTDIYPTSTTAVTDTPLLGIHIFAATDTDEGTLDIGSIEYNVTGRNYLNNFLGGANVQDTGKISDSGTWWAGSAEGYIVKRQLKMETNSSFTVVKDSIVGKYSYAVIEADGDIEHLKVATTTDGKNWSADAAYDGYSIKLTGEEKGFKISYDGTADGGVTVKRIYLTNVVVPAPAIAVPVIDASSVEVLEDFAVAQNNFTGVWEDMSTAPQLEQAALEYRLSYNNGNMVEVKDGHLVFDATNLGTSHINYKFKTKAPVHGDYVVFKVKGEDGANLDNFRFALGSPDDVLSDVVWTNQMKAGVDLPVALLDESNPYKTEDGWYYVVVNIEESGFKLFSEGYSIMDISYSGAGKLYIDNIFFCDSIDVKVPNIEKDIECNTHEVNYDGTSEAGYNHEWLEVADTDGYGTTLSFDITAKDDDFDISSLRLQFGNAGVFWAVENVDGTLKTTDGKMLSELTYVKDTPTRVVIDFAKSGISGAFGVIDVHMGMMKAYTITNIKLHTSTPVYAAKDIDKAVKDLDNAFVVQNEAGDGNYSLDFNAETDGYQYAGKVCGLNDLKKNYDLLALEIETEADTDLSGVRFAFDCGERWAGENVAGGLYLEDGTLLANAGFAAGEAKTVYIDLERSNITLSEFHIHTNGTGTGSFKINSMQLVSYAAKDFITPAVAEYYAPKYAEQMSKLSLTRDTVKPEVSITTGTTAKAGDEITVAYTASDNVTAKEDLTITVTVKKDENEVTLTDNKFTAEEGVYTVTVTVRDANGNEASDTIQITVSAKDVPVVPPAADSGCNGGCSSTSVEGNVIIGGMTLMGIGVLFAVNRVIRKKKEN